MSVDSRYLSIRLAKKYFQVIDERNVCIEFEEDRTGADIYIYSINHFEQALVGGHFIALGGPHHPFGGHDNHFNRENMIMEICSQHTGQINL